MPTLFGRQEKIDYILSRTDCFKGDVKKIKECATWDESKLDTCIKMIEELDHKKKRNIRKRGIR